MAETERYRILVPLDFSEFSTLALRRAVELARLRDAEITVLHILDLGAIPIEKGQTFLTLTEASARMHREAQDALVAACDAADPERRYIRRAEVGHGRPMDTILERAGSEKSDLIAIGTQGRTGRAYAYMGSVAERVAHRAPCDVLVVHAPAPQH